MFTIKINPEGTSIKIGIDEDFHQPTREIPLGTQGVCRRGREQSPIYEPRCFMDAGAVELSKAAF